MTHQDVIDALKAQTGLKPRDVNHYARFFKTAPGQYGEGDQFIGLTVPEQRTVAKQFTELPLPEIVKLLHQPIHEYRLTALILMVEQYQRGAAGDRAQIYDAYLANTRWINNWDLVDASAEHIVGPQTAPLPEVPLSLAASSDLWERRIGMLACFYDIKRGDAQRAFAVIEVLKDDKHDLIQKAVGWMLREIGKRCSETQLTQWLEIDNRYQSLPRTTLRYAIERLTPEQRQHYMTRP